MLCDHCVCKEYHSKFENEPENYPDDCWCGHEKDCHKEEVDD